MAAYVHRSAWAPAAALLWVLVLTAASGGSVCKAQLRRGYYAGVCPNVESIVRGVVAKKIQQTPATVGATVDALARSRVAFERAFVDAITRMGRVGVKTTTPQGNVRRDCAVLG